VPEFLSQPCVEIARRLEMRDGNAWIAVLSPSSGPALALDQLQTELRSILQISARVLPLGTATFEGLREALQQPNDDAVLLSAGADLTPEKWSSLDIMRSALERAGPVILWLAPNDVANLTEFAPNIRSFLGGSIFIAGPDGSIMTERERQDRVIQLEQHYGLSSEEIVRRAESKELPPEPHFVEWLVLLGRGDLV
jgi:hypothetical protein